MSDYRSKLHDATPKAAAETIENLQRKLVAVEAGGEQTVYIEFRNIVKSHPALGKPLDAVQTTDLSLQAWYQHAMVLWINSLSRFFVLTSPDVVQTWPDPRWDKDPKWSKEDELIKMFGKPPMGFHPPDGGIAYHWYEYGWKATLGWRVANCYFYDHSIRYQQFENGLIVGPFHKGPDIKASQEFVILDKQWFPVTSSHQGADCSFQS